MVKRSDAWYIRKIATFGRQNPLYDAERLHAAADRLEYLETENQDLRAALLAATQWMVRHMDVVEPALDADPESAELMLDQLRVAATPRPKPLPVTDLQTSLTLGQRLADPPIVVRSSRGAPEDFADSEVEVRDGRQFLPGPAIVGSEDSGGAE